MSIRCLASGVCYFVLSLAGVRFCWVMDNCAIRQRGSLCVIFRYQIPLWLSVSPMCSDLLYASLAAHKCCVYLLPGSSVCDYMVELCAHVVVALLSLWYPFLCNSSLWESSLCDSSLCLSRRIDKSFNLQSFVV